MLYSEYKLYIKLNTTVNPLNIFNNTLILYIKLLFFYKMGCICKKAEPEPSNFETGVKPVDNLEKEKPLDSAHEATDLKDDQTKAGSMVASVIILHLKSSILNSL